MNDLTPQLLRSLKDYSKEKLVKDLISGVIVAIIALPLSIALQTVCLPRLPEPTC